MTAVTNGRVLRISDWPYAQPPAAGAYDPKQALGWLPAGTNHRIRTKGGFTATI